MRLTIEVLPREESGFIAIAQRRGVAAVIAEGESRREAVTAAFTKSQNADGPAIQEEEEPPTSRTVTERRVAVSPESIVALLQASYDEGKEATISYEPLIVKAQGTRIVRIRVLRMDDPWIAARDLDSDQFRSFRLANIRRVEIAPDEPFLMW